MHGVSGVHFRGGGATGEHKWESTTTQTTLESLQVLQNLISSWMVTDSLHSWHVLLGTCKFQFTAYVHYSKLMRAPRWGCVVTVVKCYTE